MGKIIRGTSDERAINVIKKIVGRDYGFTAFWK